MKKIIFTLFIAMGLFVAACQETGDTTQRTPNGFEITFVEGPSDTLVSPGDIAKIYFQVSNKDSMVTPTQVQDVKIPRGDDNADIIGGIAMMGVGDSAIIDVPFDSLPAQTKQNPAAAEGLSYHIGVISVMDSATFMKQRMMEQQAAMQKVSVVDSMVQDYLSKYKDGTLKGIQESDSGLEYYIIDKGSGGSIQKGDQISVNYYGVTKENGQMFDNSFKRGQGFNLAVGQGQVIPGWDEGLMYFNYGGEGLLFIPSNLAYGEQGQGPIKPNSDLVFYVDIDEK